MPRLSGIGPEVIRLVTIAFGVFFFSPVFVDRVNAKTIGLADEAEAVSTLIKLVQSSGNYPGSRYS